MGSLSTAFFEGRLDPGQLVGVGGRFSRYGHIYCPRYLYPEARERQWLTDSWASEHADRDGKRILMEGSPTGRPSEFRGFEIYPPFPMSATPRVSVGDHAVGLGFLYPSDSVGSEGWVRPRTKAVPVLYPVDSDVLGLSECVVHTTARVSVLPSELDMVLASLRPKISKNLLDTWYRPLSTGNRGFCLSLVDEDGAQDARCSISVDDPEADVPLRFRAQWMVEYHFEGIDLTGLSEDAKDAALEKGRELLRDTSASVRTHPEQLWSGSWRCGVPGTGFGWTGRWLNVSIVEPNRLLVMASVDLVVGLDETLDWLPAFCRKISDGLAGLCGELSGQKGQPQLDFLYDFAHQGHYQSDGALASLAATNAVAGSQQLQLVRGWLRGART